MRRENSVACSGFSSCNSSRPWIRPNDERFVAFFTNRLGCIYLACLNSFQWSATEEPNHIATPCPVFIASRWSYVAPLRFDLIREGILTAAIRVESGAAKSRLTALSGREAD